MTDIVVKHGREFEFGDGVPEDVRDKRIANWMQKNAPEELEQAPQAPTPSVESAGKKSSFSPALANVASFLSMGNPGMLAASLLMPEMRQRMGDVNTYRTMAQGALPFADEATAGVRSMIPGQPDYTTALGEERQGVKDYGEQYGEADKIGTELFGTGVGLAATAGVGPLLQGAGRAVPMVGRGLGRLGKMMTANPWKSAAATGAVAGGVAGFGAGEGGLDPRMESARDNAITGGVLGPLAYAGTRAVDKGLGWLNQDNRVANLLRRKLAQDREGLATSRTLPRNAAGDLDTQTPDFTTAAMADIRGDLRDQRRRLRTEPMMADLLPGLTEQVVQKPGTQAAQLGRNLTKRQYDRELPEDVAQGLSQRGRIGDAFDTAFGQDAFKTTDEQLLKTMKDNADVAFKPAYQKNIKSAEIDDALDRIKTLNPNVWAEAKKWADAERRSVGSIDATGNLRSYNTQFLHDIKRALDQTVGAEKGVNYKFNDLPYLNAKKDLNTAMKTQNPEYEKAMALYGEDASRLGALKKGREEVFGPGSVDVTGGMDAAAIKAHLADPNITQAEKDLFRQGAARALREKTIASGSKLNTHNWASFIGNPKNEELIGALQTDKLGSWDLLRAKLMKEDQNFRQASRAMNGSQTAKRLEMSDELSENDVARLVAGAGNPTAFGSVMAASKAALSKLDPVRRSHEQIAEILGRRGSRGNQSALRDIEELLRTQDTRRANYKARGAAAPAAAAYSWPYREETF